MVTAPQSKLASLKDLKGRTVSASVGPAADGTLVRALQEAGLDPNEDIRNLNQQPSVGASRFQAGSAEALSQFVARPGLLAFQGRAKALCDGAECNLPTVHGVTARQDFAEQRPKVLDAFLRAQIDATRYLNGHPVRATEKVAEATGVPPDRAGCLVYTFFSLHP